ncbi:predicted protein [Nematostella vectensis]|uniref:ATP-grasp domain-containing protein n=1 Tax=Nematostella vectensis TaxID=45351 RepID=A7RET6_NEMVE|nr:predicted protein [Nematostella vectensis]|eukprot:XP_001641907.1 predicted protein [Nematostella vectensis]
MKSPNIERVFHCARAHQATASTLPTILVYFSCFKSEVMDPNNNIQKTIEIDTESVAPVLTLGNLFKQDLKNANILSAYPTSFVQNYRFLNDKKYRIFDLSKEEKKNNPFLYLYPGRICPVAGDEFPILMDKQPSESLIQHWKQWLPDFPEPNFKTVDEGMDDADPIITIFPMQKIPEEKHAVEPDMHYHILLKSAIPETGAPCPKHFSADDAVFPCMVKVDQSLSGYGNYVVYNQEQLDDALQIIKDKFGKIAPYVITEFVENVTDTFGSQFYLTKSGEIQWLGTNVNLLKDYDWVGSVVDWDVQEDHKNRVYEDFVIPVAEYLHSQGYFGIAGIDVITSPSGDYLVDLNPRLTGFTPHALIAPYMAKEGLTKSLFKAADPHDCTTEELLKRANFINEQSEGRIVVLFSMDVEEGCIAAIVAFGESVSYVESLFDCLSCEKLVK